MARGGPTLSAPRPFTTARGVVALVLREVAATSRGSGLGYLWAILETAGAIALITVILSFAFRSPPIGTSFAYFYASGIVPFLMYVNVNTRVAQAISYSKPLLVYPRVTFIDSIIARFLLTWLTQVIVFCIIVAGLLALVDTDAVMDIPKIILSIFMAGMIALGVGTMNCLLTASFPTWGSIWRILNRPTFLLSGVIYTFESVPADFRYYLWFNPLIHVIGQMRTGFYSTYDAEYVSYTYLFSVSLGLFVGGLFFLRRYHRYFIER